MTRRARTNTKLISALIDANLSLKIDLVLMDPRYDRVRMGARSHLIERLLREWLESIQKDPTRLELAQPAPLGDITGEEEEKGVVNG